jgi:protein-S-isoprenylcysteine O-methyltransferase Ste14
MKYLHLLRIAIFILVLFLFYQVYTRPFSTFGNIAIIVGGMLLSIPVVWLGRVLLDRQPTINRAAWVTTFVHYSLVFLYGSAIMRAILTYQDWMGWVLPIPDAIGLALVVLFGAAAGLVVLNLALEGLGAPFAIALSRKLAVNLFYAWTRNPMVLATLGLLLSLGIWLRSALFVLWVLVLFSPAILVFLKVYEERELEIRFGQSYLDYKSRTPMLFPRKPLG